MRVDFSMQILEQQHQISHSSEATNSALKFKRVMGRGKA